MTGVNTMRPILRPAFFLLAMALASCGVEPARDVYYSNPADLKQNTRCVTDQTGKHACRIVADKSIHAQIYTLNAESPSPQMALHVGVSSIVLPGAASQKPLDQTVFVDASRIRLEEGGKTLAARFVSSKRPSKWAFSATFRFDAPSGVDDTVRLIFLPGAIKIGGRSVPFAPIRFEKVRIPGSVQVFVIPV
jgi:hypothetical protein